ncbi:NADH dehydrogenase [ubiquinone] 1 alpha subcomplex assembly factor 3 [Anoplophora glabripennis]|uniref:NADH dehydrogenase [ubiquinone] 1 alpha subcomplex assembly factor 3 n=1 Tax=Anoplophora glabripennis TaxID=217634 RepID=UPI0008735969|nr:NADH dehydrogenase [ubiquinone] 1 alpha subcomplex assembly factor 3 [Anoplophora glabripennis]
MNKIYKEIAKNIFTNACRRGIHRSTMLHIPGAYEGEGKTTIHILNKEAELGLMIDGYSQVGFRLNNDMTILGPMVIFSRSVLSWNVEDISEITEEAFSLFSVIEPKLDIIVLGVGDKVDNFNFYKKILPFSKKFKIPFEILPTDQACATFNFLNSEGRYVAGAMIPPKTIAATENDELLSKMRYQNLYDRE